MKNNMKLWAIFALSSILVCGCTSIRTRSEMLQDQWKVYPGVQQDVTEIGDAFSGELQEPGWIRAMVASILVVDLPFSTVFDTIVMPYDLYRVYQPKAEAEGQ